MGDIGHGVALQEGNRIPEDSVTGVGGPVLLAASAPELGRGDVLAGRYQIEALIGTGGSGRVLRAFDRVARAAVALKILRSEYVSDPLWTERFSRELRVGRQIQHRNVCRVFDIGDADGQRFLSMELATRGTIRGEIGDAALKRPLEDRLTDARAVVAGAAALHAAGIIHRDLKPENILRMEDGRLVVSDFGLATDPGAGPTTTIMVGTPRYMAPEVVMGDPATVRADVWALGMVLHEILFGMRPDRSVIKRGARLYTPPPLSSTRERRLAQLCARCAEEDPRSRPASAVDVRREFEAAVLGRRSRHLQVTDRRRMIWGAVAIAAVASLGVIRDRWTSRAVASSSQLASSADTQRRVLQPVGSAVDWSRGTTRLANFDGRVHCLSFDRARNSIQVIWGEPRHAEEIAMDGTRRAATSLLPETYQSGCPQASPDGRSILFEKTIDGAQQILVSSFPDGRQGKSLVRGSAPRWLANGQEFSFAVDSLHAGIFSISTREMTVVADNLPGQSVLDGQAVDQSGSRLAVLYTTESFGNVLVVHALPGLEVLGRSEVPRWARNVHFGEAGRVLFTVLGPQGDRQLVSANSAVTNLRRVAMVSGADVQEYLSTPEHRLISTRKRTWDLYRQGADGALLPVTTDGRSVNGSLSPDGRLLVQRALPDSREVIVLRRPDGSEVQISDGPTDTSPSFVPNTEGCLYVSVVSSQIMECSGRDKVCHAIYTDQLIPGYPTADPSAEHVAYVTSLNVSRVRVISRTRPGTARDLGPVLPCAPVWTSNRRLWVAISNKSNRTTWAEMDIDTTKRTGETRTLSTLDARDQCGVWPKLPFG
ncbi:MAG: protein kinase, partial [Polyangia bacterium]